MGEKGTSRGLPVISVRRGDISSASQLNVCGRRWIGGSGWMGGATWRESTGCVRVAWVFGESLNPKSKSASRFIVVSLIVEFDSPSSDFAAKVLSQVAEVGVELPRARVGVTGLSAVSAAVADLCLICRATFSFSFSAFFASMIFLKSFREKRRDMFGLTHFDLACARAYASFAVRSWLIYIP